MKYSKIESHEKSFLETGLAINGADFTLEKKSIDGLDYIKCRPGDSGVEYFYNEKVDKSAAVLHLTEGYLKSDVYYLTHQGHVSVAFLLARTGDILNLHPSSMWAYHLGKKASGGNTAMSKATIAIEISNIGGLKREGDLLITRYGDVYCHVTDHKEYHQFVEPYRGYRYFATCTDMQYKSLAILLRYLNKSRGIELNFLDEEVRYQKSSSLGASSFKGILSHVNFRDDLNNEGKYKKVDIGPGFQWSKLINSLND